MLMPAPSQQFLQPPTPEQRADIRLAASKMTGATRRSFEGGDDAEKCCGGDARQAENALPGWDVTRSRWAWQRGIPSSCASVHSPPAVAANAGKTRASPSGRGIVSTRRVSRPTRPDVSYHFGLYASDGPRGSGRRCEPRGMTQAQLPATRYHGPSAQPPGISLTQSGQSQTPKEDQKDAMPWSTA